VFDLFRGRPMTPSRRQERGGWRIPHVPGQADGVFDLFQRRFKILQGGRPG
jgi:hypothetical protein